MPSISVERTVGKTKKAVLDGLISYNNEKMGKQKYKRLAISLRVGDKIVGGIVGEVWTAVLFVQLFWMEQKFRGKGFGKKLIKATSTTLDSIPNPNQTMSSGASATLGIDWKNTT